AQVQNLIAISKLRQRAQRVGLSELVAMGSNLRAAPANLPDSLQARLRRMYPGGKYLAQASALIVPMPQKHGEALTDAELITWVGQFLDALFPLPPREEQADS